MKKLINLFFIVGLITMFNASSCNKPDPEPELPTSENTAYYYLDGQLIIPKGYTAGVSFVDPIVYSGCLPTNNSFTIDFNDKINRITIFFKNPLQNVGSQQLTNFQTSDICDNTVNGGYLEVNINGFSTYYYTTSNSGIVNITELSSDYRKFKGTFEMDVTDSNGNVKHITEGHFNINLDTLNN